MTTQDYISGKAATNQPVTDADARTMDGINKQNQRDAALEENRRRAYEEEARANQVREEAARKGS